MIEAREVRPGNAATPYQIVAGFSAFLNACAGGSRLVTLSARAGKERAVGSTGWRLVAAVIDALAWVVERNHCEVAFREHVRHGLIELRGNGG